MTAGRRRSELIVRSEAAADIAAAASWYEAESAGLGVELIRAIDVCLNSIRRWPDAHRIAFSDLEPPVRQELVRRFPYSVYYVVGPAGIRVLGCLHQHRDPETIRREVEDRAV